MVYRALGLMSGSSIDGLDIAYCVFTEVGGKWDFAIENACCVPFDEEWKHKLTNIEHCTAKELMICHTAFGHWMGMQINDFITTYHLQHKIAVVGSHGHTAFHLPAQKTTVQIGCGAAIAATTQLVVVSDLRAMDIALGGQGAPIVPIAEKLLFADYTYFLNLGGIANISIQSTEKNIAFDICAANRVLNNLAKTIGKDYDAHGEEARKGTVNEDLLQALNAQEYFTRAAPKSLGNEFGMEIILPIFAKYNCSVQDKLHTMCHHIAQQIYNAVAQNATPQKMLVTGGGAYNTFLLDCISQQLQAKNITIEIPNPTIIEYKEALAMALIAVLRWREETNVLASVTGASSNSVGGALWMGQAF